MAPLMSTQLDRLSKEDLGALLDACPGPLLLADRDGSVAYLNRAARLVFGDDEPASLLSGAEPEDAAAS